VWAKKAFSAWQNGVQKMIIGVVILAICVFFVCLWAEMEI
jgi:hypothetical protein